MAQKHNEERRKRAGRDEMPDDRTTSDAERQKLLEQWAPKTEAGKLVKNGEITSLDELFEKNYKIAEQEIVDMLVPNLAEKMVDFKKTTRVRRAGRQFSFRVSMLVGDRNRYVGLGTAKDKERWPATKKALKNAKLNLLKVKKGCGSWECTCGTKHTVPFKTEGKAASVRVTLLPAPRGTGLVAGDTIKDVLKFVGVEDVWCKTKGSTSTKLNFVTAAIDALSNTNKVRMSEDMAKKLGV